MSRHEWKFEYTESEILEAVQAKIVHHNKRLAWWQDEFKIAQEELNARGVEFKEDTRFSGNGTHLAQAVASIPQDIQKRLTESGNAVERHTASIEQFALYKRALIHSIDLTAGKKLELTTNDLEFFGL